MALSPGGFAAIVVFLIIAHMAAGYGYYRYLQKRTQLEEQQQQQQGGVVANQSKFNIGEKMHGFFRWTLFTLIAFSWIFSISNTVSCQFLRMGLPVNDVTVEFGMGFSKYFAPPAIQNPSACNDFDNDLAKLGLFERNTVAFIFAIFNCVLTSAGLVGIVAMQFFLKAGRKRTWLSMQVIMYISLWCCMFTFYIEQMTLCYEYDCSLGSAGVLQVFNVLFLIIISALLFVTDYDEETAFNKCRTTYRKSDEEIEMRKSRPNMNR